MGQALKQYWVILPAYNESARLGQVLKGLKAITPNLIVVNDGSADSTAGIARRHRALVLTHLTNLGKGAALKTGCLFAFRKLHASAVIFIDADGQHLPSDLPHFIQALEAGYPLVFGVRRLSGQMPLVRRWSNRCLSHFVSLLFGRYLADIPCGYKAITKQAFEAIDWDSHDYAVELEITVKGLRSGLDYTALPIQTIYYPTDRGMSALDALKSGVRLIGWRLFS